MRIMFFFLMLFVFAGLIGCSSHKEHDEDFLLQGDWEVYEALRDESVTNTLEDGYFSFTDSIMETNIIGSPISGVFRREENSFVHHSDLAAQYNITFHNKDTLHLKTEIRGFQFDFKLKRKIDSLSDEE